MYRFIPSVVVLAPHDSNAVVYAKSVNCFACSIVVFGLLVQALFSDWLINVSAKSVSPVQICTS